MSEPPSPGRRASCRVHLQRIGWLIVALLAATAGAEAARAFGLEDVAARARRLASESYHSPAAIPDFLLELDYDAWREIRFRPDHALWRDTGLPFTLQFFHPGLFYDRVVRIHQVRGEMVEPVDFAPDQFEYGRGAFHSRIPQDLGYAGFRIHYPIKTPGYHDEVAVFLGASYFRAVGREHGFGLSARGLAIDTALSGGEEFPWFREYWILRPRPGAKELTFFALLDSPSVAGAYRFVVAPGPSTRVDVSLRLFPRNEIRKLGIAPLTSMFLRGESHTGTIDDYRPEVHDSDGLLVETESEWIWRPLETRRALRVTSFAVESPRGFGLLQRDRAFDHYQDLEVRPELRPSAWVAPSGDWGTGRVELVEIPTKDDTNDNVVTYFIPARAQEPVGEIAFAYSIHWYGHDPGRPPLARAAATRRDAVRADVGRMIVDFEGRSLEKLPPDAVVQAVVDARAVADPDDPSQVELLDQQVIRNPVTKGLRLTFRVRTGDEPVELRAFLRYGDEAISETWSYLYVP